MSSDINRLLKHSWIYTVGNVLDRVGAFILLPLYTNHLSLSQYGTLELFYTTKEIISSMMSIGLAHATLRFYFEYDDQSDRNKVVSTSLLATSFIAAPFLILLSFFSGKISLLMFDTAGYASLYNLVYAILLLEMSTQVGFAYMRAKEYSILYVATSFLRLVAQVSCSVYLVAFRDMGIQGVLIGNLVSVSLEWIVLFGLCAKECGLHFDFQKLKAVINYSHPFFFSSVATVVLTNADKFILKSFGTMEGLGIYSLALKFGMLLQVLFLEPFSKSFGAYRFSIMKQDNAKDLLSEILNYRVFGLLLLGVAIILSCKPVLLLMSSPDYLDTYKLVPIIILAAAVGGMSYVYQTGILYEKKTKFMFYITLAGSVIGLTADFVLIPRFGAYGAGWSTVVKASVATVLTYVISQRLYPIRFENARVVKMYLLAAAIVIPAFVLPLNSFILSAGAGAVLIAAFPLIAYKIGCIEKQDVERIGFFVRPVWAKIRTAWQPG
jgi:O-antigen/teichoic acid export membrane protein